MECAAAERTKAAAIADRGRPKNWRSSRVPIETAAREIPAPISIAFIVPRQKTVAISLLINGTLAVD
jgi:hypothetical protein